MESRSPVGLVESVQASAGTRLAGPDAKLTDDLYALSGARQLGWDPQEFAGMLAAASGRRPEGISAESYLRSLQLHDLALAQACARGFEPAWERFVAIYRAPLKQAAAAVSRSQFLGEDLADSLYAELFGLRDPHGERRSPLASYSGRGSLMGWLRATLAQRHVDRFRRTKQETPLEEDDYPSAAEIDQSPASGVRVRLETSVHGTLRKLQPEERFLLAAYFLDERTLVEIARLMRVHEATVSRKLKRLAESVRKQVIRDLQDRGLSRAAAEEALGTDPRDLSINLRRALQTSTGPPFSDKKQGTAHRTTVHTE